MPQSNLMKWEVVEDKHAPGTWRAEAIDYENEGDCYAVIFVGPRAETRARDYVHWLGLETVGAV